MQHVNVAHRPTSAATMAERRTSFFHADHRYGFPPEAFDPSSLPDFDREFLDAEDLEAFAQALHAPDALQSPQDESTPRSPSTARFSGYFSKRNSQIPEDGVSEAQVVAASAAAAGGQIVAPETSEGQDPSGSRRRHHERTPSQQAMFISAQSDWAPVNQKVKKLSRRKRRRRALMGERSKDETREGYLYSIVKWPLFLLVFTFLAGEWVAYLFTRLYISSYEQLVAWRGKRATLRRNMASSYSYQDWVRGAKELDNFLGRQAWKDDNEFAYYDSGTVRRVLEQMRRARMRAEAVESKPEGTPGKAKPSEDLRALLEASIKNNFVGVENPRLYSQTYYGTKNLVQGFVDEGMFSSSSSPRYVALPNSDNSREKCRFRSCNDSAEPRREEIALQTHARQLRADSIVPVRWRDLCLLPHWRCQGASRR